MTRCAGSEGTGFARMVAGIGRADYSAKHRRHGVNVQVVTDLAGRLLWISPALPGRTHDLTAARTHRIIRFCERQGVPILASDRHAGSRHEVHRPATAGRLPVRSAGLTGPKPASGPNCMPCCSPSRSRPVCGLWTTALSTARMSAPSKRAPHPAVAGRSRVFAGALQGAVAGADGVPQPAPGVGSEVVTPEGGDQLFNHGGTSLRCPREVTRPVPLMSLMSCQLSRHLISISLRTFRGGCPNGRLVGGVAAAWFAQKRRQGTFSLVVKRVPRNPRVRLVPV